jgi:hypothetical protein
MYYSKCKIYKYISELLKYNCEFVYVNNVLYLCEVKLN